MNNPQKLNIRIKFAPKKPEPEIAPEETGYIYHWNRIIGASLLLASTLAGSVYGVFNYLAQAESRAQGSEIESKTTNPVSLNASAAQAQTDNEALVSASSQQNRVPLTLDKNSAEQRPPDGEAVIAQDSSKLQEGKSLTVEKTIRKNNGSSPLLTLSDSKIFSKQIKPFLIAKTVKDREPVGSINDIKLDVNNIVTVYAYSKVFGLKGETLYYKWRLNGKDIAQVKVKVRADRWRSYSRKFIQPHMQGDWSVTLENRKGEILAINRFQY